MITPDCSCVTAHHPFSQGPASLRALGPPCMLRLLRPAASVAIRHCRCSCVLRLQLTAALQNSWLTSSSPLRHQTQLLQQHKPSNRRGIHTNITAASGEAKMLHMAASLDSPVCVTMQQNPSFSAYSLCDVPGSAAVVKTKQAYKCSDCGEVSAQWKGRCPNPSCEGWNTYAQPANHAL